MKKSKRVLKHQKKKRNLNKRLSRLRNMFGRSQTIRVKHSIKMGSYVGFPRRITRWRAFILNCGHRNYLDWER